MGNPNPVKKFQPGKSGNPGGRPKMDAEVQEMLKAATPKAVASLIEIAEDGTARKSDRIRAIEIILDRVYGKSPQPIVGDEDSAAIVVRLAGDLESWGQ